MKTLKNFFECYFNQSFYFEDLDEILQNIKKPEHEDYFLRLITELHQIIQTKSYALAAKIIKKHGSRTFDNLEETKKFINFLYDRLVGKPTNIKAEDFTKKINLLLCPVCCPESKKIKVINLIEKATIIQKNMLIFICKACKLVWPTTDIQAKNALDYKKFMKTLGLKGLWKELCDVDSNLIDHIEEVTYMDTVKSFFSCYFTENEEFEDLDNIIQNFKGHRSESKLIAELHHIIQSKKYKAASEIIKIYGKRVFDLEKTEKFIKFLYDKFLGKPTTVRAADFAKKA